MATRRPPTREACFGDREQNRMSRFLAAVMVGMLWFLSSARCVAFEPVYKIATFSVDVTCPVGHPLIAGLRQPAKEIIDPLQARGFVLLGAEKPIVLCAVDWCEIRNRSYEKWRKMLAEAAQTDVARVLVCSLHQHDAPVTDVGAAELLAKAGLPGAMFDPEFEDKCIRRTAKAVSRCLQNARRITHLGIGQAKVDRVASNRRVVIDGKVSYARSSASGGNMTFREAPDGLIDPWLKTLSFWDRDQAVLALHAYATHPMSYYGRGGVSWDFVGMARDYRQRDNPNIFQVYVTGCSGDVTAGKYNNGAPANREVLARRLYDAMKKAWQNTTRHPLESVSFRKVELDLAFRQTPSHTAEALRKVLHNPKTNTRNRILAAMGLASRLRLETGLNIDMPMIDFRKAKILLFPGETFVGYQLQAQQMFPDSFVLCIGFGECWPGYIPTTQGFQDRFNDAWYWVADDSDKRMTAALKRLLAKSRE
ncbi:MAG: hypothetical protein KatS3mg105_3385 [Gemmatales bacterium]|nr:MAG: hypothetical protein KatS3mg105_3385 [Gemmatales bacterium]